MLVLSEFAGASWELPEALQVNPYDTDGTAEVFFRALSMDPDERRARLAPLAPAGGHLRRAPLGLRLSRAARAGDRTRRPRSPSPTGGRGRAARGAAAARSSGTTSCSCCSTTTGRWCRSRRLRSWPGPTRRCVHLLRVAGEPAGHRGAHRERPEPRGAGAVGREPADLAARGARLLVPAAGPGRVDAGGGHPRRVAGAGARRSCATSPRAPRARSSR